MSGARPLAVYYFMKVVWVANISRLHLLDHLNMINNGGLCEGTAEEAFGSEKTNS